MHLLKAASSVSPADGKPLMDIVAGNGQYGEIVLTTRLCEYGSLNSVLSNAIIYSFRVLAPCLARGRLMSLAAMPTALCQPQCRCCTGRMRVL